MNKQLLISILSFFLFAQASHGSTSSELIDAATAGQSDRLMALIDGARQKPYRCCSSRVLMSASRTQGPGMKTAELLCPMPKKKNMLR